MAISSAVSWCATYVENHVLPTSVGIAFTSPKWVFHYAERFTVQSTLTNKALACITGICAGAESLFYVSLRANSSNSFWIIKTIQETAVARIHDLQARFNYLNAYLCLAHLVYLIQLLVKEEFPFPRLGVLGASTLGLIVTVLALAGILNDHFHKTSESDPSVQQKMTKVIHIAKITAQFIVIIHQNRLWAAFVMLTSCYSFLKNSRLKWLVFSKKFELSEPPKLPDLHFRDRPVFWETQPKKNTTTVIYSMLALPVNRPEETCTICQKENPDTAFCMNHSFHQGCLEPFAEDVDSYFHRAEYRRKDADEYQTIKWTQGGKVISEDTLYMGVSSRYFLKIPKSSLPCCPNCRAVPVQNTVEAMTGNKKISVSVLDSQ
jgi:hypothetical protein